METTTVSLSQRFFQQLSEKDKRLFAAQESRRRGWGGMTSVSKEFQIALSTIVLGLKDLEQNIVLPPGRVRKHGGGRKSRLAKNPELHTIFMEILGVDIAGNPQSDVRWTHLSKTAIQQRFAERGHIVGIRIIAQLLKHHGFGKRKHQKNVTMGQNPDRDAQFQRIAEVRSECESKGLPMVSIDTKKRASW